MNGTDIGAYMLGASIGASNAESRARHRARMAELDFDMERIDLEDRIAKYAKAFAYQTILAETRARIRMSLRSRLEKIAKMDDSARISVADVRALFADEIEADKRGVGFIAQARAFAAEWLQDEPDRKNSISWALARIEKEYA